MNPILSVENVSKRFGERPVLDRLSLAVPPGSITVLLGANGAGKSTLLRMFLGLVRPDVGRIRVYGLDPIREARAVRRSIGYVPDQADAHEWMTPRELFGFLAPQYPTWNRALETRLVERLAIPLNTSFGRLSRGESAKAMLVAAMAIEPRLYVLDEVFAGLDVAARDDLLRAFLEELDLEGRAALVVTHELDIAARLADRIALLSRGRIALEGSLEEVLGDALPGELVNGLRDLCLAGTASSHRCERNSVR